MKKNIFIFIILLLSGISCVTQKPQRTKTNASEYNPTSFVLHPQYKVFHASDSYSKLYMKLFTNELRFSRANEKRVNLAIIKVSYKIKPSVKSNTILDSTKTILKIKKTDNQTSIISFFKIKNIAKEHYIIEINLADMYANRKSHTFIRVDNSENDNDQYYLSLKAKNHKPLFSDYFRLSDSLIIIHKNTLSEKIQIKHFKNKFKEAEKPYITQELNSLHLKADTSWTKKVSQGKILFNVKRRGIYLIKADTLKHKGILKVNFSNTYPLITKSVELVKATKYLLPDEEYQKMLQSDNKKLSIDNFWLQAAKNKERAREILKIWYNRSTFANYYFTSYKEGWKTDRGMIYMMFGPPDDIKNFDDAEKWIYINSKEDKKLEFIFVIPEEAISHNDFILLRDAKYITSWNRAVKSWHRGIVYHY